MFEEICLVCGKHLPDDGRAYCSDDCENVDAASPSISSNSSAWSSPQLDYTMGGDVPPLVPSALGSALSNYAAGNRHSISSSSASSVSWSALTDDEDESDNARLGTEEDFLDGSDAQLVALDGSAGSKSSSYLQSNSGLRYARRPSSTNTRSTIPLLHRRTSSGSSSKHVHGVPSSAPSIHSSTEDDEDSAIGSPIRSQRHSESYREKPTATITAKPKRSRNRASLPGYFSLLQMTSPSPKSSPLSPSPPLSGKSAATRASPSTPKLALTGLASGPVASTITVSALLPGVEATPRGRRREPGSSRDSRSQHSRSRSRSRHISRLPPLNVGPRARLDSRSSVEQVFDWTSGPVPGPRGRPAVRRNSSPLPKMMLNVDLDHRGALAGSESRTGGTRGRMRAEEMERSLEAPGYGNGRSGLVDREREPTIRSAVGLW